MYEININNIRRDITSLSLFQWLTLPSGKRVTELMSLSWPRSVIVHLPVLISQTLARLSHEPYEMKWSERKKDSWRESNERKYGGGKKGL